MSFNRKINTINEALLSKEEIKGNKHFLKTIKNTFDLKKYKGVRKNILRPLFKNLANKFGVQLANNGKTLIFDFQSLHVEKDTMASRQLNGPERLILSNLLHRYQYEFDDSLFLVGNAKTKDGKYESLINIFNKIKTETGKYQKYQDELDKLLKRKKKIETEITNIDKDKKHINKSVDDKNKIIKSKKETLEKVESSIDTLTKTLNDLRKDEESFNKLEDKIYKYNDINYKILITYIPWRVASMSTFSSDSKAPWSSCMNLQSGVNKHYVGSSMSNGAFVAYLIRPGDEKNIDSPLARVLIKPFVRVDNTKDYEDYDDEEQNDDDDEYYGGGQIPEHKYAEINYLDDNVLDKIFWYVDLVYPRGGYPLFRNKVVQIFDHLNKTKEGTFIISKGQYVDSKEKIELDDVFIYVNRGDYSDLKDKNEKFITKIIERYPFEFFSNWPDNQKMPENLKIRGNLDLSDMDIRRIPEGLNISGNIFINNLNIRKIKNVTCHRLTVEKNENLLTIENCNVNELKIINNKNLVNIENNNIKNELFIFNCDNIKSLDNLNLRKLYIKSENQNETFVFGKNLKAKDLFLSNFKLKSIPFALKIDILTLNNVSINSVSGDFEEVEISGKSKIKTLKNLNVKYRLRIDDDSEVDILENIFFECTLTIRNPHIKRIINLNVKQNYEQRYNNYVGTTIQCKNLEEIVNLSAEKYLSFYECNNLKKIENVRCDGDIKFGYCNIKNKDMSFLSGNILSLEKTELNIIDGKKIKELIVYESKVDKIIDLEVKKIDIGKSKINEISNVICEEGINIDISTVKKISDIKAQSIYLTEIKEEIDFNFKNIKIESLFLSETFLEKIDGLHCDNLHIKKGSHINLISNSHFKKEIKINQYCDTGIGKNVVFGQENQKNDYILSGLNAKHISPDFKVYGDVTWKMGGVKVFPKMTIKGTLEIKSDDIEDIEEGAEIDYFKRFGVNKMFYSDDEENKFKKNKIIKKIKTLETIK